MRLRDVILRFLQVFQLLQFIGGHVVIETPVMVGKKSRAKHFVLIRERAGYAEGNSSLPAQKMYLRKYLKRQKDIKVLKLVENEFIDEYVSFIITIKIYELHLNP